MNIAVLVMCGTAMIAIIAIQAAENREQRKTIERLVAKCCDLPPEAPQGAKTRVVSGYIKDTEDKT